MGPPTGGTHVLAEFWRDALGGEWVCTGAGTPGTWIQIRPAAVTADPDSGTIPTGYLIWNVTTGETQHHAGGYSWTVVGGGTGGAREALSANRTYYIAATGSDSNSGLSAGAPFLTIQKAIDTAASLDTVIYAVTIQVADGTYEQSLYAKVLVGAGGITIQGNSGNASAVIIRGQASKSTVQASQGAALALKDVKLEGNASGYALVTASPEISCQDRDTDFRALAKPRPDWRISRSDRTHAIAAGKQSVGKPEDPLLGFSSEPGAVLLSSRHRTKLGLFASRFSARAVDYAG